MVLIGLFSSYAMYTSNMLTPLVISSIASSSSPFIFTIQNLETAWRFMLSRGCGFFCLSPRSWSAASQMITSRAVSYAFPIASSQYHLICPSPLSRHTKSVTVLRVITFLVLHYGEDKENGKEEKNSLVGCPGEGPPAGVSH